MKDGVCYVFVPPTPQDPINENADEDVDGYN